MASATKKTKAEAPAEASPAAEPTIPAWKGFDPDLKCRGYQFTVGETFEHIGQVAACSSGFHACENPFDVWSYYGPVSDSGSLNRFARVSLSGQISRHSEDSKIAAGRLTLDAEIALPEFLSEAVKWIVAATKLAVSSKVEGAENYSGDSAQIGSSGGSAKIGSSGGYAQIGSSGDSAQIGSSGGSAQIGSSGGYAKIGSSGGSAQIGSSGGYAQIGSSGGYAQIGSSGGYAKIEATGANAVVACAGTGSIVKAGQDGAICIAYHDGNRARFAIGYVGEDGIKAGVFYTVRDGKLAEAV